MRLLLHLSLSFILCIGACHSPVRSDKKGEPSALSTVDSAGHRLDSTAATKDSVNINEDSIMLSNLKARFADTTIPFKGLWVNEHYVNAIRQGKPIRESQDTETSCINIPDRTLQGTSFIFGFHEGGEGLVVVKNGSDYLTYALHDGHCVDTLRSLTDGRLQIGRENYVRIGEADTTLYDLGVLEQLLFAGEYRRLDAAGTVVFKKNGKIDGLDSLGWYDPAIDYADWGYETKLDHIRLGADREHLHDYGFRFVGNTLEIYTIDCLKPDGKDCVLDTLGRKIYSFQKVE